MAHPSSHGAVPVGPGGHGHVPPGGPRVNHETTDIPLTGTTRAAIIMLVVVGIIMLVVYGWWLYFLSEVRKGDRPAPALAEKGYGNRVPAMPRLQTTPGDDLARYRAAQDGKLGSYGWVDRNGGVVHIPIDRAMELMAERAATIADPNAAAAAPAAPAAPVTAAPTAPQAAPAPAAAAVH